jgi:hypothetical protein
MDLPQTAKGALIGLGILAVLILLVYAASLLSVIIGAVMVAVVLYIVYVIGVRVHRYLRDRPVLRGRGGGR